MSAEDDSVPGLSFAARSTLVTKLAEHPNGDGDSLMSFRLYLNGLGYATIFSAYALTMDSTDVLKTQLYESLRSIRYMIPKDNKIVVLGDFNARAGVD